MKFSLPSQKNSEKILESLLTGQIQFSLEGQVSNCDAVLNDICGSSELQQFGQSLWLTIQARRQTDHAPFICSFQRSDDTRVDLKVDVTLQHQISGEPTGYLVLVTDVTHLLWLEREHLFHRDILLNLAEGVCLFRANDGIVIYTNPKFETLFGWQVNEALGKPFEVLGTAFDGYSPVSKDNVLSHIKQFGVWTGEVLNLRKDGSKLWSDTTVSSFDHPDHGPIWISLHEDITDKKHALEILERSEKKYRDLFENSRDAILIIENEMFVDCNQATLDMLGYQDKTQFLQQHPSKLSPAKQPDGRDSAEKADEMMQIALDNGSNRFEWDHVRANGEVFPVEVLLTPLVTEKGITVIHTVWRDITKEKQQRDQVLYQAHYDSLTGLPNRFLALDRLEQRLKEAYRRNKKVAVLFLDLDNFKKINDTLGHAWGDKILQETARRLLAALRQEDTVGRLGGDEFIVLLGDVETPEDVSIVAGHLIESFRVPFHLEQRELILTASIGIAFSPDDATNSGDLLRLADTAMYHSKQFGRNNFHFFTEKMNTQVERKLMLEEHLHGALDRGEFYLHYQPLLSASDQKVVGAEALLRWHNKHLGNVSPEEFIAVAEQTGQIVNIGEFVMEEAMSHVAKWQRTYSDDFRIAINVSPRQFRDPNLVSHIQTCLQKSNLSNTSLELEITEGVLLNNHSLVNAALEDLNKMGVRLAMDDFGTGYSSMSYLRFYPFDTLKIDRSFIRDVLSDKADRALVCAMIDLGHSLGLKVVAEGVETAEQGQFLREKSCDYMQGYYYSRPLCSDDFDKFLEKM